jgi:hypothetical protein
MGFTAFSLQTLSDTSVPWGINFQEQAWKMVFIGFAIAQIRLNRFNM